MPVNTTSAALYAAAQESLDLINEQIEIYKIANRVANNAWVVVANDNPTQSACLTAQDGGHNFGGGPSGAVVFDLKSNAERAAKSCRDLFDSDYINPVVVGLGDAYRRKFNALLELRKVTQKTLDKIEG